MTLWYDYEIRHHLCNKTQKDNQEDLITELLTISQLIKRALHIYQIFCHILWAIAYL